MNVRRLGVLAAIMMAIATPVCAQTWSEFAFPETGVGFQMPAPPTVTAGPYGAATAQTYEWKDAESDFSLTVADFSGHGGDQGAAVRDAMTAMRKSGQLRLDVDECINGQPGREFSIAGADGSQTKASIFAVGPRLYLLTARVGGPNADDLSGDAVRFQQSMRFAGGRLGPGDGVKPVCRGRAREASQVGP